MVFTVSRLAPGMKGALGHERLAACTNPPRAPSQRIQPRGSAQGRHARMCQGSKRMRPMSSNAIMTQTSDASKWAIAHLSLLWQRTEWVVPVSRRIVVSTCTHTNKKFRVLSLGPKITSVVKVCNMPRLAVYSQEAIPRKNTLWYFRCMPNFHHCSHDLRFSHVTTPMQGKLH